jgi:hypothetical protein
MNKYRYRVPHLLSIVITLPYSIQEDTKDVIAHSCSCVNIFLFRRLKHPDTFHQFPYDEASPEREVPCVHFTSLKRRRSHTHINIEKYAPSPSPTPVRRDNIVYFYFGGKIGEKDQKWKKE